ncbi:MAG: FAD-binding protein [Bacteroidales bacterium]|nr:FAD-binding protein [Bacteroidales bacterium]
MTQQLKQLQELISCEIKTDYTTLVLYSTDASAYRQKPIAVVYPADKKDIKTIITFCNEHKINIIFRGAGTSLAGQVVGEGIVVDISKHFCRIKQINAKENYVWAEPGVVRDILNYELKQYNKFFAPETSTSNRCTLGGMVGNNSCGLHSVAWGTTRDNILELECILADGSEVTFKRLTRQEFLQKTESNSAKPNLETGIYRYIYGICKDENIKNAIKSSFPNKDVIRRNNGYALDEVLDEDNIDVCRLIAGSEGTLCYITAMKLKIMDLPSQHRAAICVHFNSLSESFLANLRCLEFSPIAVELMDENIISAAKRNKEQSGNLFFISGNPKAIIVDELCKPTSEELEQAIADTVALLKKDKLGYQYTVVRGEDIKRVWELRKAGLGLLTNVPGDSKPVSVVEDTAVAPKDLPQYMEDFALLLKKYGLDCVYHAHIASGELHLRPVLNLKKKQDVELFRKIAYDVALLVKKYGGSLSGEHGDGRLRGEFIPLMYGDEVYKLMQELKKTFDPNDIFNRGKIVNTPPMDACLRYGGGKADKDAYNIATYYSFDKEISFLQAVEQCNGAGVCRKDTLFQATMCPSFRISGNDERFSTRARANILREIFLSRSVKEAFASHEIKELLDDSLMFKGSKRECPSNVDMTKLKSEYLQHYYQQKGTPLHILLMGYLPLIQKAGSMMPQVYNFIVSNAVTGSIIKKMMHFSPLRTLPKLHNLTFRQRYNHFVRKTALQPVQNTPLPYVYLLVDEFSQYQDAHIAETFLKLLHRLGYEVRLAPVKNSGRILFSKGLVKRGKKLARHNIDMVKDLISDAHPLVGLEPSAVLSFRDEYPSLTSEDISQVSKNCLCFDEFLYREYEKGNIKPTQFTEESAEIIYHTHCQQKAIVGEKYMQAILSIPKAYYTKAIPSGCCGMAGSFGYEAKHYKQSEAIVHQVLIPYINNAAKQTLICASGTSCRQQIADFCERKALHPVEILYNALK